MEELGIIFSMGGKDDKGLETLLKAVEMKPNEAKTWYFLGVQQAVLSKYD